MKRIASIVLCITLLFVSLYPTIYSHAEAPVEEQENFATIDSYDIIDHSNSDILTGDNAIENYPLVSYNKHASLGENITISYEFPNDISDCDVSYSSNGFELLSKNVDITTKCVTVDMQYDSSSKYADFELVLTTPSNEHIVTNIFAVNTEDGIFLSDISLDNAIDSYYYSKVEDDEISEKEYNDLLIEHFSNYGESTCEIIKATDVEVSSQNSKDIPTITVTGTLSWKDDNGVEHPLQYVPVNVFNTLQSTGLGTVYTDANGNYSLTYSKPTSTIFSMSISFHACGDSSAVFTPNGGLYSHQKSVYSVEPGDTVVYDWCIDMSSDYGKAFQICQAVNVAECYAEAMSNQAMPFVSVVFPYTSSDPDDNDTHYTPSNKTIYLYVPGSTSIVYKCWDTITHEYGHHVQNTFNMGDSPGGYHSGTENSMDTNTKEHGSKLAWAEGWANFFAIIAQQYYSSTLQNIDGVADSIFNGDGFTEFDLENETIKLGEGNERSIAAILYDLYDNVNDYGQDSYSFGHTNMWNRVLASGADNFSDFANYLYNNNYVNKTTWGINLSHYKFAPQDISIRMVQMTTGPTITLFTDSGSEHHPFNRFDLIIYDGAMNEILRTNNLTAATYTLTSAQWNTVLYSYGTNFSVCIVAYQTDAPSTGPYYSKAVSASKPITNTSDQLEANTTASIRYLEKQITLSPSSYCDINITFATSGTKLIQTFGTKDTIVELYNSSGNLLDDSDDEGYSNNSLLTFYLYANRQYTIRVKFYNPNTAGTTKLSITPSYYYYETDSTEIDCYEDILRLSGSNMEATAQTAKNYTSVLTLTVPTTGTYTIELESNFDSYLYVIDPRSSERIVLYSDHDDDSGTDRNPLITKTLQKNIPYLIIISGYNIQLDSHNGTVDFIVSSQ